MVAHRLDRPLELTLLRCELRGSTELSETGANLPWTFCFGRRAHGRRTLLDFADDWAVFLDFSEYCAEVEAVDATYTLLEIEPMTLHEFRVTAVGQPIALTSSVLDDLEDLREGDP